MTLASGSTLTVCDGRRRPSLSGYLPPIDQFEAILRDFADRIRTFVSLMEEHETNNAGRPSTPYAETVARLAAREGANVRCERFPITDVSIPSVATMRAVLDCIDGEIEASRAVYVHCFGGIGRTGTVVACWLLRHGLASPNHVEEVLKRLRIQDTERATRRSPETDVQLQFVTSWKE